MAYELYQKEWARNRQTRGVLFDLDGLVLDTEKLYSRFWMEACHFYGFPMTYEQSLGMRALNAQRGEALLKAYFGEKVEYLKLRDKRIQRMEAYVDEHGVDLKPGVRELLDYLDAKQIPAAIASSSPVPRIRKYLAFHGLDTRFAALCSGRDVPRGKPEPDIYRKAAEVLGLDAASCMALEDAPAGIQSAYRAGCLTVMVPDQDQPSGETKTMLYAKADSLLDVVELLREIG